MNLHVSAYESIQRRVVGGMFCVGKGVVSKSSHEVEADENRSDGEGQGDRSVETSDDGTSGPPAGDRTAAAQGQTQTYVTSSLSDQMLSRELHCVSKNIPNIFDCNLKKNYQILISFNIRIFLRQFAAK